MNVLIVGGTSGLGLELAHCYHQRGDTVYITGRSKPDVEEGVSFFHLNLFSQTFSDDADLLLNKLPRIDTLVYAAGFFQEGHMGDLSDQDIDRMIQIGIRAPALLVSRITEREHCLSDFVGITSTSAWTPREKEPLYTAVKAALDMFGRSLSFDPHIKKVLVAGPSGMQTSFWNGTTMDTSTMLNPTWVAGQIVKHAGDNFTFRSIRLLREPPRVEVFDERI